MLLVMEKRARESESLKEAEQISGKIKELREKQILLRNFAQIEENQKEYEAKVQLNEDMILEFNQKWDEIKEEILEFISQVQSQMESKH